MAEAHTRLGDLLLAAGLIDAPQLERALQAQRDHGLRLGEALVRGQSVTEVEITQVLSNQLSVAWVSLDHVRFTAQLLARVSAELAHRHGLMPVHFRRDQAGRDILYVAMEDPTNIAAMHEVSAHANVHVRPLIAMPSELRRSIAFHYLWDGDEEASDVEEVSVDVALDMEEDGKRPRQAPARGSRS